MKNDGNAPNGNFQENEMTYSHAKNFNTIPERLLKELNEGVLLKSILNNFNENTPEEIVGSKTIRDAEVKDIASGENIILTTGHNVKKAKEMLEWHRSNM